MKRGEKEKNLFERPSPNPVHLKKYSLEEKEKEEDPGHLTKDHGEEVGWVSHTTHQADLDQ